MVDMDLSLAAIVDDEVGWGGILCVCVFVCLFFCRRYNDPLQ